MKNVIVYSTPTCPWCTKAKSYLKSNNIEFVEKDVAQDQEAAVEMVEKSGQRGVPVLDIDGDIIIGFDRENIDKILGIS